jgi:hypothetical protein
MWMLRSGELLAFPGLSERCAMFGRRTLKFYVGDCELCFAKNGLIGERCQHQFRYQVLKEAMRPKFAFRL